jgi:hypothetical protein
MEVDMFDFSRLSDLAGTVAASFMTGGEQPTHALSELLQDAGLDPSVLTGLPESEIAALLAEHGIDVTPFLDGGPQSLLGELGFTDEAQHG